MNLSWIPLLKKKPVALTYIGYCDVSYSIEKKGEKTDHEMRVLFFIASNGERKIETPDDNIWQGLLNVPIERAQHILLWTKAGPLPSGFHPAPNGLPLPERKPGKLPPALAHDNATRS